MYCGDDEYYQGTTWLGPCLNTDGSLYQPDHSCHLEQDHSMPHKCSCGAQAHAIVQRLCGPVGISEDGRVLIMNGKDC